MENLAVDLENAIWKKFGGIEKPPQYFYTHDKVKAGVDSLSGDLREANLGRTVCYVVSAVVVHEGRLLMMREAKQSCRGKWYLPAGRVERNESLEEGVTREVLEETGLHFQPTSIICIESQGTSWFRITFGGLITGGKIKTLLEQDAESMEAGWFAPEEVFNSLNLRCEDICPLIRVGLKWYEDKREKSICKLMPVGSPHKNVIVRAVVVKRLEKGDKKSLCCVLFNNKSASNPCPTFPYEVTNISHGIEVTSVIHRLMRDIDSEIAYKIHGYLKVEHTGKPRGMADGLCLTLLVELLAPLQNGMANVKYQLFEVEDTNLSDKIWELVDIKGCVELREHK